MLSQHVFGKDIRVIIDPPKLSGKIDPIDFIILPVRDS